ncbi:MAG: SDR family NAD(P)-dependent oxidoreductase [Verrucomicrobiota bacterium]
MRKNAQTGNTPRPLNGAEEVFEAHAFNQFQLFAITPEGCEDSGLAIAAARAGHIGIFNLINNSLSIKQKRNHIARLENLANARYGLILSSCQLKSLDSLIDSYEGIHILLIEVRAPTTGLKDFKKLKKKAQRIGCVVTSLEEAELAVDLGADFIVAKGNESGGWVGEETAFVLTQKLTKWNKCPVVAWGGAGFHSAASLVVCGAKGIVLDWQLSLASESAVPKALKHKIQSMDGSETIALPGPFAKSFRLLASPGFHAKEQLLSISAKSRAQSERASELFSEWDDQISLLNQSVAIEDRPWLTGQDACLASSFYSKSKSVAGMLSALQAKILKQVKAASEENLARPQSPLAKSLGIEFPILQGPMTRVSDTAEFCNAVATGGALPFLALAMMPQKAVRELMEKTKALLGEKPWGAGLLGFNAPQLYKEQLEVVLDVHPSYTIIAGGRPDQASALEAKGISSYLHVPSPSILDIFINEGARKFIFEGRECGGHVGPRTSLVLWDSMVHVILNAGLSEAELSKLQVIFAGGIHDAKSAAMATTIAQPLAEKGVQVGLLMGTGYLFTHEIVESSAVVEQFRKVAQDADKTVVIESSPGHAIRCADTEFISFFESEKRRLQSTDVSHETISKTLEKLTVGRLRIASKGVTRIDNPKPGESPYAEVEKDEQLRDGMYMIGQVACMHQEPFSIRDLHQEISLESQEILKNFHASPDSVEVVNEASPAPPALDIAIIGMGGFLPGANDLETYWQNILDKKDAIGEVPEDRFDFKLWYNKDKSIRDTINSKWGGFIEDVPFDPFKYGIPPTALRSIEPAQLLSVELIGRLLDQISCRETNPYREKTSVIFGAGGGLGQLGTNYAVRSMLPNLIQGLDETVWEQLPKWTEDSFPGILLNVITGRISNRFDLGGVNYTVDAACGSSLAAVYLACQELASGTSDLVMAGGCDTMQSAFSYMAFAQTGALSPTGRSKTFDESADGIAISEGVAAVALKRREDAERDGDHIYAIIKGAGGGSDGKHKSLTAPSHNGQIRTISRAYEQARYSPSSVGLFEMHGTGTALGDSTEGPALRELLESFSAAKGSAAVSSVKSMIGHTKSTAGVVGLMKAVLSLYYRVLPPTLHVNRPNPKAQLENGPLYVNTETRPWIRNGHARRAGISAFGFGGTNYHVTVEEYQDQAISHHNESPCKHWPAELFILGAASKEQLKKRILSFLSEIRAVSTSGANVSLADVAYTGHRKALSNGEIKAALVTSSLRELIKQLESLSEHLSNSASTNLQKLGIYFSEQPITQNGKVAFLFPGQGSQYPNMLRDMAITFPEVAQTFERANHVLTDRFKTQLSDYIFPISVFTEEERKQQNKKLTSTDIAQPALGVCDTAMLHLLSKFGISAEMAAGHSYGELVALHAAGSLDEEALFLLSAQRGKSITDMVASDASKDLGKMIAVSANEETLLPLLEKMDGVWPANLNSPEQTILSCKSENISELIATLKKNDIDYVPLPVSCGFHSPIMAPAAKAFEEALKNTSFEVPNLKVYSNATAQTYPSDSQKPRELLSQQLVQQVLFQKEIEAMYDAGARVFVEIGPKNVLTKLVTTILKDKAHTAIATDNAKIHGVTAFLHSLANLCAEGIEVYAEPLYEGRNLKVLDFRNLAKTAKEGYPKHYWLVNGALARPCTEAPAIPTPKATMTKAINQELLAQENTMTSPSNNHSMETHSNRKPSASPSYPIVSSPGSLEIFSQYQETMRQFLATQENVLSRLLHQEGSSFANGASLSVPSPAIQNVVSNGTTLATSAQVSIEAQTASLTSEPIEEKVPQTIAANSTQPTVKEQLLEIAASRTGYPAEMLELNADMEADLGIDSIKRVEIVSSVRKAIMPEMAEPPSWFMEKMSEAKALQNILDGLTELIGGTRAEKSPPSIEQNSASKSTSYPTDMKGELLQVVAERTGYPQEMLDMQADMEADLGIDSIKRVEIVSSVRKAVIPEMTEPPSWFMEKMSGAKTIQNILDGLTGLIGKESKEIPEPAVQTQPASTSNLSAADLKGELLQVVAERTGYPQEMLDMEADMEADLGIDSIKRIEIVAGVRRSLFPDLIEPPQWFMDKMTSSKSLEQILEGLSQLGLDLVELPQETQDLRQNTNSTSSVATEAFIDKCPRCTELVFEQPLESKIPEDLSGKVFILTQSEKKYCHQLSKMISDRGGKVEIFPTESLKGRSTAEKNIEELRLKHGKISGIIHLLPLDQTTEFPGMKLEEWQSNVDLEVKGLLFLLQSMEQELVNVPGTCVISLSIGGGDFDPSIDSEACYPWRGALSGLLKTAAAEWPKAKFRTIDFEYDPSDNILEQVLAELNEDGPIDIGYRDNKRLAIRAHLDELPDEVPSSYAIDLSDKDLVLVIGGARGITSEISQEIAQATRSKFILVGRSELTTEEDPSFVGIEDENGLKKKIIELSTQSGKKLHIKEVADQVKRIMAAREIRKSLMHIGTFASHVEYHSCDVTNTNELKKLIDDIDKKHGGIDALIHGAGVLEDKYLIDKAADSFDRVWKTKIDPMLTLSEVLDPKRLKLAMIFSSVSGFFGNPGQGDYAAANETLNRMARRLRNLWKTKVIAMNWGPWSGAGMVTPEVQRQFVSRGIPMVHVPAGRRAAVQEIYYHKGPQVRLVIGPGPWINNSENVSVLIEKEPVS